MKTPTHALIGLACVRLCGWRPGAARFVVIGAIAPDLPLAVAWTVVASSVTLEIGRFSQPAIQAAFDPIYFSDGWVPALHCLLHAPVSLLLLAGMAALLFRRTPRLRERAFAFLAGALTHAVADILSHVGDGPLVLWPLDRTIRVNGLFSHWDPAHGGALVTGMEVALWLGWAGYLGWRRRWIPLKLAGFRVR